MRSHRLEKVRASYDSLAAAYAREISGELDHRPLERELLQRFAKSCNGLICDLGCGPGHITHYVSGFNSEIFGLDLSWGVLREACVRHPAVSFLQGDMLALPVASGKLAGIIVLYSIIHLEQGQVLPALAEMSRALQPGGNLLLGVHVGREVVHVDELWGVPVDLDATFFELDELEGKLKSEGFQIAERVQRQPHPEVEYPSVRGYIWSIKG